MERVLLLGSPGAAAAPTLRVRVPTRVVADLGGEALAAALAFLAGDVERTGAARA